MRENPTHHLCSFCAGDRELHVGIFLPVSEEERKLGEEAIVGMACGSDGLGVRVTVDATLKRLCAAHEFLPSFEVIGIIGLKTRSVKTHYHNGLVCAGHETRWDTYQLCFELS